MASLLPIEFINLTTKNCDALTQHLPETTANLVPTLNIAYHLGYAKTLTETYHRYLARIEHVTKQAQSLLPQELNLLVPSSAIVLIRRDAAVSSSPISLNQDLVNLDVAHAEIQVKLTNLVVRASDYHRTLADLLELCTEYSTSYEKETVDSGQIYATFYAIDLKQLNADSVRHELMLRGIEQSVTTVLTKDDPEKVNTYLLNLKALLLEVIDTYHAVYTAYSVLKLQHELLAVELDLLHRKCADTYVNMLNAAYIRGGKYIRVRKEDDKIIVSAWKDEVPPCPKPQPIWLPSKVKEYENPVTCPPPPEPLDPPPKDCLFTVKLEESRLDAVTSTTTTTTTKAPVVDDCFCHMTGALIAGEAVAGMASKIFVADAYSEIVKAGDYPDSSATFPKAIASTFDSLAIGAKTHLTVYSGKNFTGKVLLDADGPLVVMNVQWKGRYDSYFNQIYPPELQAIYPQERRMWSATTMGAWGAGSLKVRCGGAVSPITTTTTTTTTTNKPTSTSTSTTTTTTTKQPTSTTTTTKTSTTTTTTEIPTQICVTGALDYVSAATRSAYHYHKITHNLPYKLLVHTTAGSGTVNFVLYKSTDNGVTWDVGTAIGYVYANSTKTITVTLGLPITYSTIIKIKTSVTAYTSTYDYCIHQM